MGDRDEEIELVVDSADVEDLDEASGLNEELTDEGEDEEERNDVDDEGEAENSVSAALQPGMPLYLVHRSHQHSEILPAVLNDVTRRHGGDISLGVVAPMPRMSPTNLQRFLERADAAPVRIADPEGFARGDSLGPTLQAQRDRPYVGATVRHWNYFTASQPSGGTSPWVEQVLDAQRSMGATLLLTPGMWADPATPDAALAVARQHADWARDAMQDDEHLAVNMTLTTPWLTTDALRDRLLNEVLDMDEEVFYLRVRWPLLGQPYGQLLDPGLLDGYVEVANVFEENDKVLLLPNTGLTGWLALAWGAHGFSTGIGTGERAFADTRVIRIARNRPRPIPTPRMFVTPLLHVTDMSTATLLDALPSARPCQCPFCRRMRRGQFDKALAGGHYLRRVADLTAAMGTSDSGRRVAARRIVRRARAFAASATRSVPLVDGDDPRHLPEWAARLR